MRAFVWDGRGARVVQDHPEPKSSDEMALVEVRMAGVCSTDLQILQGYMDFRGILGHEFVGEVLEGPTEWVGHRVAGEINFACHRCALCETGQSRHCPNRTVMGIQGADGAFAQRVRVPWKNLHRIPDTVSDHEAIFIEPLAAAFEADLQSRAYVGGRTAVLGAGKLGLLCAQVLALRGDDVRVVCRHEAAMEKARAVGLDAVSVDQVGGPYSLVVEATGHPDGLAKALSIVRPGGAVVQKTTIAARHDIDLAPLVIHEITMIGSRCGPFAPAIDALANAKVQVAPLLSSVLPLTDAGEAIARARTPGALKIGLDPSL
jgi:threonine dehydrogenase-like Zn-dependent dehydrogenase